MIELKNIDCMEYMATLEDNAFDLAIVDPPYGIGAGSTSFKSGTRKKADFFRENDWDISIPSKEYFDELFRVSLNQIIWGANYMVEFLPPSKGWIFWDKKTGENSYGDGELAFTSFDKALKKYERYWSGANAKEKGAIDRVHPTQKPISLYEWQLINYAKEGDKILDTHGGSFSIACALHNVNVSEKLDLKLVICEIDKDYYDSAVKRFNNHKAQTKLF